MTTQHTCKHCGKPLSDALLGLCPECMLKAGLGSVAISDTADPAGAARFVPPSPQELSGYFPQLEIMELLGRGGMGAVYKARQKSLDRLVALKILPPGVGEDPAFAERFAREARAMAQLSHPSIVTLYEFGQADGLFYFLMEFVDGVNLAQLMNSGRLAPNEALAIVPQICDGLQFAHDRGIVHRDIKPENILLRTDGMVKIADFGVAKIVGLESAPSTVGGTEPNELTQARGVLGTPQYMAPEQVEHPLEVDHRADIYSLGVVFYQMLTGELPLVGFAAPSKKVQIDVRLDEIVLRALEKEPALRYQQASVLKTQVETIASTPSFDALPSAAPEAVDDKTQTDARTRVAAPAVALLVIGGINLLIPVVGGVATVLKGLSGGAREKVMLSTQLALILLIAAATICRGAVRMRRLENYAYSVVASIFAMLTPPGLVLGLPVGIWSLIILSRRDVREAFEANRLCQAQIARDPTFGRRRAWKTAGYIALIMLMFYVIHYYQRRQTDVLEWQVKLLEQRIAKGDSRIDERLREMGVDWDSYIIKFIPNSSRTVRQFSGLRMIHEVNGRKVWQPAKGELIVEVLKDGNWQVQGDGQLNRVQFFIRADTLAEDSPRVHSTTSGRFLASLGKGITVELIGISRNPSSDQPWWKPDGSPLAERPYYNAVNPFTHIHDKRKAREICMKIDAPKKEGGMTWVASGNSGSGTIAPLDASGKRLDSFTTDAVLFNPDTMTTDIKVGVSVWPWQPVLVRRTSGKSNDIEPVDMTVNSEPEGERLSVDVTQSFRWEGRYTTRFIAIDLKDQIHTPDHHALLKMDPYNESRTWRHGFNLKLEDIKEFRFEMQPHRFVEFRNVSLEPGHQTDVQIVLLPTTAPSSVPAPR